MTFIIHFKDGHRETYNNRYDEDVEHETRWIFGNQNRMLLIGLRRMEFLYGE